MEKKSDNFFSSDSSYITKRELDFSILEDFYGCICDFYECEKTKLEPTVINNIINDINVIDKEFEFYFDFFTESKEFEEFKMIKELMKCEYLFLGHKLSYCYDKNNKINDCYDDYVFVEKHWKNTKSSESLSVFFNYVSTQERLKKLLKNKSLLEKVLIKELSKFYSYFIFLKRQKGKEYFFNFIRKIQNFYNNPNIKTFNQTIKEHEKDEDDEDNDKYIDVYSINKYCKEKYYVVKKNKTENTFGLLKLDETSKKLTWKEAIEKSYITIYKNVNFFLPKFDSDHFIEIFKKEYNELLSLNFAGCSIAKNSNNKYKKLVCLAAPKITQFLGPECNLSSSLGIEIIPMRILNLHYEDLDGNKKDITIPPIIICEKDSFEIFYSYHKNNQKNYDFDFFWYYDPRKIHIEWFHKEDEEEFYNLQKTKNNQ